MDELDKRIKKIWEKGKKRGPGARNVECPEDEILSQYVYGLMKEPESEKIEQHLAECDYCLSVILFHKRSGDDEAYTQFPDAPLLWKEKVRKLFTGRPKDKAGIFDIVLKFTKETIEVISNPGNLAIAYGAVPEPVRSVNKIMSPDHIVLSKTLPGMESEIEIERVDDRHVTMRVRTVDIHSKAPLKLLRVSLFNPVRELASYITDDGEVSFGNLAYGEYAIKIIRGREEIGRISMNITLNTN